MHRLRERERQRDELSRGQSPGAERRMEQWKREVGRELSSLRGHITRAMSLGNLEERCFRDVAGGAQPQAELVISPAPEWKIVSVLVGRCVWQQKVLSLIWSFFFPQFQLEALQRGAGAPAERGRPAEDTFTWAPYAFRHICHAPALILNFMCYPTKPRQAQSHSQCLPLSTSPHRETGRGRVPPAGRGQRNQETVWKWLQGTHALNQAG